MPSVVIIIVTLSRGGDLKLTLVGSTGPLTEIDKYSEHLGRAITSSINFNLLLNKMPWAFAPVPPLLGGPEEVVKF